jgi:hypothetical protein
MPSRVGAANAAESVDQRGRIVVVKQIQADGEAVAR